VRAGRIRGESHNVQGLDAVARTREMDTCGPILACMRDGLTASAAVASDPEHATASIRKVHVRRQQLAVTRAPRGDFRRTNIETSSHAPACLKQVFAACVREIAIAMLGQWDKARNMEMNVVKDSTIEVWCVAKRSRYACRRVRQRR
jgi:hypothetical protein